MLKFLIALLKFWLLPLLFVNELVSILEPLKYSTIKF